MPKRAKSYHAWLLKRLTEPREAERYLKVAMADSAEVFLKALRNVAEARQMARIAVETGLNRENLYRTLSQEGNPRFDTLNAVLDAVGMRLDVSLKNSVQEAPPDRPRIYTSVPTIETSTTIAANVSAQLESGKPNDYVDIHYERERIEALTIAA